MFTAEIAKDIIRRGISNIYREQNYAAAVEGTFYDITVCGDNLYLLYKASGDSATLRIMYNNECQYITPVNANYRNAISDYEAFADAYNRVFFDNNIQEKMLKDKTLRNKVITEAHYAISNNHTEYEFLQAVLDIYTDIPRNCCSWDETRNLVMKRLWDLQIDLQVPDYNSAIFLGLEVDDSNKPIGLVITPSRNNHYMTYSFRHATALSPNLLCNYENADYIFYKHLPIQVSLKDKIVRIFGYDDFSLYRRGECIRRAVTLLQRGAECVLEVGNGTIKSVPQSNLGKFFESKVPVTNFKLKGDKIFRSSNVVSFRIPDMRVDADFINNINEGIDLRDDATVTIDSYNVPLHIYSNPDKSDLNIFLNDDNCIGGFLRVNLHDKNMRVHLKCSNDKHVWNMVSFRILDDNSVLYVDLPKSQFYRSGGGILIGKSRFVTPVKLKDCFLGSSTIVDIQFDDAVKSDIIVPREAD